jgi:hypothetical protein
MKKAPPKIKHANFTERPGDSGIYTGQGDYVGTIEDDHLRNEALIGLNGELENDEDSELLEFLEENDLDLDGIKELIEIRDKHETIMEKIDEVHEGLAHLAECVLIDVLVENDYEYIDGLAKTLEKIEQ